MSTLKEIRIEWDRNAVSRCKQIESGADISHDKVLLPSILKLAGNLQGKFVLDVGSGCGFLTNFAARRAKNVLESTSHGRWSIRREPETNVRTCRFSVYFSGTNVP